MNIIIRKATPDDVSAIDSFNVFSGERRNDVEKGDCYVAEVDGAVAGYVVFNRSFFMRPFIQFLCVNPASYRMGVATKLLDHIEEICDGELLFTSTESNNVAMLRLLDRRGYKSSGVIDNLQEDSEIVFCKKL